MATVCLSNAGLDQVAAAQADFDAHVVSSGDGQCVTCAGGPCPGQANAVRVLVQFGQTSSAPARSDAARTYRSAAPGCVTGRPMTEIRLRSPTTRPTQPSRR